jgi:TDG/mug DNA glycosylase family protein
MSPRLPAAPAGPPGTRSTPPSKADLEAARDRTIPDLVAPGLTVLLAGINPGLYTTATGFHFGRPGNRFWKVLHLAGFTGRQLDPSEQSLLLAQGVGITNVVQRTTATAAELAPDELRAGGEALRARVRAALRPRWLAVLGVTAYRVAFDAPGAQVGRQEAVLDDTHIWLLPNPSGLNAHYQLPRLVDAFRELRDAAFGAEDL